MANSKGARTSIDPSPDRQREHDSLVTPQHSTDSAHHDHDILDEEQERQDLLACTRANPAEDAGLLGRVRAVAKQDKRHDKRRKRWDENPSSRRQDHHARRELMHEMEEGGPRSPTPSSDGSQDSSEIDREKMGEVLARRKASKRRRICRFSLIQVLFAILFIALAYGAYKATSSTATQRLHIDKDAYTTNGTSLFPPTTILISLDGFRADFLSRRLTPTLQSFIRSGVSPEYMIPSFPSLTFPNHYTLVTGLYPEHHGIVSNSFWDTDLQESFYYTNKEHSMQPKWWNAAEPLWETAERQGVRTAIHMWPGSEAHIGEHEPSHIDKYNGSEVLPSKVDRILGWLDKPGAVDPGFSASDPRPGLIAAYVPNVDADGHLYGPNSTEIRKTIMEVDSMLNSLLHGLERRNLTEIVNVVIVSDHGMATTDTERTIQLEDLVDTSLIEHTDGWPHYGLRPKNPSDVQTLYTQLKDAAEKWPDHPFDVYLKENDMPSRFHFSKNDRIAPLWIMPHAGWAIVKRDEFNVADAKQKNEIYHPRGIHGYDHEDPLMRAIFVARGPAFPHKPGAKVKPFQNTEIYNVVCDSLGLEPVSNDGEMRLPLKTIWTHASTSSNDGKDGGDGDGNGNIVGEQADGVKGTGKGEDNASGAFGRPLAIVDPEKVTVAAAGANPSEVATKPEGGDAAQFIHSDAPPEAVDVEPEKSPQDPNVAADRPPDDVIHEDAGEREKVKSAKQFWDWAKLRYEKFVSWAKGVFGKGRKEEGGEGVRVGKEDEGEKDKVAPGAGEDELSEGDKEGKGPEIDIEILVPKEPIDTKVNEPEVPKAP